jgi:hypothetical protein
MKKMQDNETLLFNQSEESDIPAWKWIDDALRAMTVRRQHEETLTDYQKLKDNYQ